MTETPIGGTRIVPKTFLFCIPGGHAGPEAGQDETGKFTKGDWREVRARLDKKTGKYVYDPKSPMAVMCCPHHHVEGEPLFN